MSRSKQSRRQKPTRTPHAAHAAPTPATRVPEAVASAMSAALFQLTIDRLAGFRAESTPEEYRAEVAAIYRDIRAGLFEPGGDLAEAYLGTPAGKITLAAEAVQRLGRALGEGARAVARHDMKAFVKAATNAAV